MEADVFKSRQARLDTLLLSSVHGTDDLYGGCSHGFTDKRDSERVQ
jgi:hypothetical protein